MAHYRNAVIGFLGAVLTSEAGQVASFPPQMTAPAIPQGMQQPMNPNMQFPRQNYAMPQPIRPMAPTVIPPQPPMYPQQPYPNAVAPQMPNQQPLVIQVINAIPSKKKKRMGRGKVKKHHIDRNYIYGENGENWAQSDLYPMDYVIFPTNGDMPPAEWTTAPIESDDYYEEPCRRMLQRPMPRQIHRSQPIRNHPNPVYIDAVRPVTFDPPPYSSRWTPSELHDEKYDEGRPGRGGF